MECCQLCGETEEVSTLDEEFVPIVNKICELSFGDNISSCMECSIFLYQIQVFTKRVIEHVNERLIELDGDEKNMVEDHHQGDQHELFQEVEEEEEEENATIIEEVGEESYIDDQPESDNDSCEQAMMSSELKEASRVEQDDTEKLFSFKCHVCDVPEFQKMSQLSVHTRSEHKALPAVKCCCDKLLSTMRALERHRVKHFPHPSDFRCTDCPKAYKTHRGLDNHFDKTHGQLKEMFICAKCGRSFCERKTLERHEITHTIPPEHRRNFQCSECQKRFISADAMRIHHANHHEKVLTYFCDVCSKGFYTRKSLISHEKIHMTNEAVSCDLCSGTFKSLKYMQKHRQSHFLPPHHSFLVCDICQKQFRKKSQMKSHMLIHSAVAEHSCSICSKTFKKKCYLKSHMVSHTGEKNFRCNFCERSFADSGNCRKHKLRDHPEELAAHEAKYGKKGVSNALFV